MRSTLYSVALALVALVAFAGPSFAGGRCSSSFNLVGGRAVVVGRSFEPSFKFNSRVREFQFDADLSVGCDGGGGSLFLSRPSFFGVRIGGRFDRHGVLGHGGRHR